MHTIYDPNGNEIDIQKNMDIEKIEAYLMGKYENTQYHKDAIKKCAQLAHKFITKYKTGMRLFEIMEYNDVRFKFYGNCIWRGYAFLEDAMMNTYIEYFVEDDERFEKLARKWISDHRKLCIEHNLGFRNIGIKYNKKEYL
jgi:hypothetical protein